MTIPGGTTFPANTLFVKTVTDPDGSETQTGDQTITFTDLRGRVVLSRRQNNAGSSQADTYYAYDDKDRVTTVIPPGASGSSADLIYTYLYSDRDLILSKKLPGQARTDYKYNDRDLLTYL